MTTVLYIEDVNANFVVKKETEKAYLLRSTSTSNQDCWFPKSGFEPMKNWNNKTCPDTKREDGSTVKHLSIKSWLWNRRSPEQEALLYSCKPVYGQE